MKLAFPPGYDIEVVERDAFTPYFVENRPRLFTDEVVGIEALLDEPAQAARGALAARMGEPWTLRAFVRHGGEIAGWTAGRQVDAETFMMQNTALWPEHRGRGVYKALLPWVLERARAEGFQVVTSRHHATNNRVLVPKLKAGFLITGFEVSDRFGLLLQLSRFFDPAREHVVRWRTGAVRTDDAIRRLLPPA